MNTKKAGAIVRGLLMGILLTVAFAEIYLLETGVTVFRYQGF